MASRIHRHSLTVPEQSRDMQRVHPDFYCVRTAAGMSWRGRVNPTPLSDSYTIEIVYRRHTFPQVWVRDPVLRVKAEDYQVVHIYSEGCLCLHADEEWRPYMAISATIVPWSYEWLLYYELWLATGQWHGGGEYRIRPKGRA